MRGSALTVAILALASVIVVATAVPCQQMSLIRRTRTSVAYDIGPGTVSVYPYADGRIYAENHMMWNMSMLVERNRSSLNVDGSSRVPTCSNPSGGHSVAVLDPLAPNVDGQPCPGTSGSTVCGVVASFLLVRDMDCAVEEVTEPFHGYTRDSIYVTMTHPQYPDFKLVAGHHLLNGTVEVYPLPNATWVVNRYQKDTLKLSYDMTGYPWKGSNIFVPGPFNLASTVSLWYNISIAVQAGAISDLSTDQLSRKIEYVSADNKTTMAIDMSSVYISDGTPYVIQSPDGSWGTIPFEYPLELNMTLATGLCNETLGQWSETVYDPTFGVLFAPDPTTPKGRAQKGLNGSQIAAIAVVVPVLVIVAAIAIGFTLYKRHSKSEGSNRLREQRPELGT